MGEMIKFGIKLAMVIATALAIMAAIVILFNLISSAVGSLSFVGAISEIFGAVSVCLPFNMTLIMSTITALMSFKVAFWAADKMIELEGAIG